MVRTHTAKLIKYPGHDDWTEVFDLKADPYETKNLANDPQHAALRRALEAEYGKQAKAIGFEIPASADKPAPAAEPAAEPAPKVEAKENAAD